MTVDNRFLSQLGIESPILQAPIGSMAGIELAAAVSNAGGLGSLALTWTPPDSARQLVADLRARTSRPFFVNFVLTFPPAALDAALEAGAPVVTFSWGLPGRLVEKVHRANALVGVQVGTGMGARLAQEAGADFVICQGVEAGGHVQSTRPLAQLLPEARQACGDLPIVAAGAWPTRKTLRQRWRPARERRGWARASSRRLKVARTRFTNRPWWRPTGSIPP
jgi:nitronate monooxygenase